MQTSMEKADNKGDELSELLLASFPKEISPGVSIRRIKDIPNENFVPDDEFYKPPRMEIAIIINEGTKIEDIRAAWNDIWIERDKLEATQGTDLDATNKDLLQEMYDSKINGSSYADIAHDLNFDLALYFLGIYYNDFLPTIINPDELSGLSIRVGMVCEWGYQRIIDGLKIKQDDLYDWLKYLKFKFRAEEVSWTPYEGPITRYLIINKLRQYKQDIKIRKIVVKKSPDIYWTQAAHKICYEDGFYQAFVNLFWKSNAQGFERYRGRMRKRLLMALRR
jgi:hypothetical protein